MPKSGDQGRKDIVVYSIIRDSTCAECGRNLRKGQFLRVELDQALCLACADLDHLIYLPSGEAALTRRAKKYSKLHAVVVRFSRTRRRYERKGLLVEESALEHAERECLEDAEARAAIRERAAERRARLDEQFVVDFGERIREQYPGCPPGEERLIAEHACRKYSGRVGRSEAAKRFDAVAIDLAVRAHVRHVYTEYDEMLTQGRSREESRAEVSRRVDDVLRNWNRT